MLLMSSADVTSLLIPRRPLGLVAALCLVLALALAVPTASKANASAHRALPQMLEISTRPWLYALSQKYGRNLTRFSDIPDAELDAIQSRGFDVVWFMGVWQLGNYGLVHDQTDPGLLATYKQELPDFTLPDVIGSPYAVVNYQVNPQLGNESDLKQLRARLAKRGLLLMLDFVPNHSAVDCPWSTQSPAYYVHAAQSSGPYDPTRYTNTGIAFGWAGWGGSWTDTIQYNYWNPALRAASLKNLMYVASMADYIRCDMAFLLLNDQIQSIWGNNMNFWGYKRPPTEFWSDAIVAVKQQFSGVQFLAEVYDPYQGTLQGLGFDFTYDKDLYDKLGVGNLDDIRFARIGGVVVDGLVSSWGYISGLSANYIQQSAHSLVVENHDEPRAAAFFGSNMRADAAAMVTMTLPGMRFYNWGQREGFFNRLDVHLRRSYAEPEQTGVEEFYDKFTNILNGDIFHRGQWSYQTVLSSSSSWRLMAWKWTFNGNKVLIVINYSDTIGAGSIIIDDATPTSGGNVVFTELISGEKYVRSNAVIESTGLEVVVNYWSLQMFSYS